MITIKNITDSKVFLSLDVNTNTSLELAAGESKSIQNVTDAILASVRKYEANNWITSITVDYKKGITQSRAYSLVTELGVVNGNVATGKSVSWDASLADGTVVKTESIALLTVEGVASISFSENGVVTAILPVSFASASAVLDRMHSFITQNSKLLVAVTVAEGALALGLSDDAIISGYTVDFYSSHTDAEAFVTFDGIPVAEETAFLTAVTPKEIQTVIINTTFIPTISKRNTLFVCAPDTSIESYAINFTDENGSVIPFSGSIVVDVFNQSLTVVDTSDELIADAVIHATIFVAKKVEAGYTFSPVAVYEQQI